MILRVSDYHRTLLEFQHLFPDETVCARHLFRIRWPVPPDWRCCSTGLLRRRVGTYESCRIRRACANRMRRFNKSVRRFNKSNRSATSKPDFGLTAGQEALNAENCEGFPCKGFFSICTTGIDRLRLSLYALFFLGGRRMNPLRFRVSRTSRQAMSLRRPFGCTQFHFLHRISEI